MPAMLAPRVYQRRSQGMSAALARLRVVEVELGGRDDDEVGALHRGERPLGLQLHRDGVPGGAPVERDGAHAEARRGRLAVEHLPEDARAC